jgi:hypothetical protein
MKSHDIKKLVEKYSSKQLETCIRQQLDRGQNECDLVEGADEVIEELSQAEVIREMMDKGMAFSEALRELGRRIRAVYGKDGE